MSSRGSLGLTSVQGQLWALRGGGCMGGHCRENLGGCLQKDRQSGRPYCRLNTLGQPGDSLGTGLAISDPQSSWHSQRGPSLDLLAWLWQERGALSLDTLLGGEGQESHPVQGLTQEPVFATSSSPTSFSSLLLNLPPRAPISFSCTISLDGPQNQSSNLWPPK